jgi:UDP-glucose 4-epimerase
MVLPRFVDSAIAGQPLTVHDDGRQVRCFAHVADVVATVLALMQTPAAQGKVFNIGSDHPVSMLDLANKVIDLTGSKSAVQFQSYTDAYDQDFEDIRRRVPDLSRLRTIVTCPPQYDLNAIIRDVIAWKKGHSM